MPAPPRPPAPPCPRWLVVLTLAVALLSQWMLPPFMGEDEPWHLEYAEHVAAGHLPSTSMVTRVADLATLSPSQYQVAGRFPGLDHGEIRAKQAEILAALDASDVWRRVDWAEDPSGAVSFDAIHPGISAAAQPPGYYLLAGAWLRLCPFDGTIARLRWLRLLSALCYVAVVGLCYHCAGRLGGPAPAAAVGALAALMPMHLRQAATVNPDVLAKLVVALATYVALRGLSDHRRRWLLIAALAAGVAPWIKSTAVSAVVPAAVLALVFLRRRFGRTWPVLGLALLGATIAGAVAALRSGPVIPANLSRALERLQDGLAAPNWIELFRTLLGAFGWYGRTVPSWFAALAVVALVVALIGLLRGVRSESASTSRPALLLLILVLLTQFALVALRGEAAGRYLYPALPAATALAAFGWWSAWAGRLRPAAAPSFAFLLTLWFALAFFDGALLHERMALGS
ncbi:glycosyltransferase family 39 protein [Engelhardtia mirabilis]|uniref:Glycosyltransferase RgtA/B/C/D-like domain-containing protein n=1 Tax=Engelhardtia mirabilis TaxID=2528011 RepID=A0A518BLH7_9BACT|nr:hypothetical protein Pla133_29170 [Planctomycetes bacterium Pla133]QDV02154.1 hypothetical protein Pla86_29160 [Planctomycetes bacterium Pla86]